MATQTTREKPPALVRVQPRWYLPGLDASQEYLVAYREGGQIGLAGVEGLYDSDDFDIVGGVNCVWPEDARQGQSGERAEEDAKDDIPF